MASKSLTALPSIVSVAAEKTVVALRCHTRGFEKVAYPILAIMAMTTTLVLLAVAAGTPMWVQVDVRLNGTDPRGVISFGLFRGDHSVQYRQTAIPINLEESYYIFDKYFQFSLNKLYAAFAFSVVAMLLCIPTIAITFLNSYQTVTTWWKGPQMMYILSFSTALSAFIAMGLFVDFYIWDFDSNLAFTDSTMRPSSICTTRFNTNLTTCGFGYLLNEGYTTHPSLQYSYALHCVGSIIPMFVLLLSWRLTVLLPPKKGDITPSPSFGLQQSPSFGLHQSPSFGLHQSPSMNSSGMHMAPVGYPVMGQPVLY